MEDEDKVGDPVSGATSRYWAAKGARFIVTQLRFCDLGLLTEDGFQIALKLAEIGEIVSIQVLADSRPVAGTVGITSSSACIVRVRRE
jgi:hypothetical protein